MEDLARIVAVMFAAWIAAGAALAALAWLAPVTWNRTARLSAIVIAALAFVLLTAALFGVKLGIAAALPATLVAYLGFKRG